MNQKRHKTVSRNIILYVSFFICVLTISFVAHSYYSEKERKQRIDFVVSEIKVTPALRVEVYDQAGTQLNLNSFTFFEYTGIKLGDSIVKNKNSSDLVIYRKNEKGKYTIFTNIGPD